MTHRKGAIWTERVLLALILGSLFGSLNLIVALNRRSASRPTSRDDHSTITASAPTVPSKSIGSSALPTSPPAKTEAEKRADAAIVQKPPVAIPPAPRPVDPTQKIVASLTGATAVEIEASQQADRRSAALEQAWHAAVAESRQWKRRDVLVRQQIASLNKRADELETSANILDAERDVLAHERDALKAALSKASRRSGFAVLPYKGPNGTWRRPIVLECTNGMVKLQPQGLKFTTLELSPYIHPRSSPFVRAVAQELLHIQSADTPDGAPVVPYLVFLVRPDGIRPYYEARSRLEPLGIAFGYELIEQDLAVDIPDFDNLTTWDGSVPLDIPLEEAPQSNPKVAMLSTAGQKKSGTSTGSSTWPGGDRTSQGGPEWGTNPRGRQAGADSAKPESSTPDDFVWPSRPRRTDGQDLPGAGPAGLDSNGDPSNGTASGYPGIKPGLGQPGALGDRDASSSSFAGQPPSSRRATSLGDPAMLADINQGGNGTGAMGSLGGGVGSKSTTSGGSAAARQAQRPLGPGSGLAGVSGPGALPDLEPVGDVLTSQRLQPPDGSSTGSSTSAGTGIGGQSFSLGGAQTGGGAFPTGGGSSSLGGGQAGGGPVSNGGGSSLGQSAVAGGGGSQFSGLGGGQAGGGTASAGGAGSANANVSDGGAMLGLAPYPGAGGAVSTAGSGSTFSNPVGLGQSSVLGQGSGGGGPTTASPGGTGSIPSDMPSLPPSQSQIAGSSADSQQTGAGLDTASGPLPSSGAITALPQGSNFSGSASASGSNSGTPSGSSLASSASSSSSSSATTAGSSSPSSSLQPSSTSAAGGLSLGSMSSGGTPSASGPTFSLGQDFGSASDSSKQAALPPLPKQGPTMGSIEVPFEIVVVCRQGDLLLHPGGYRLTTRAMKAQGGGKDGLLALEIRALVRQRAQVDPMIRPRPKISFLVESNGSETFWAARRQLMFSLPDWPMSLQVAESQSVHVFNKETW